MLKPDFQLKSLTWIHTQISVNGVYITSYSLRHGLWLLQSGTKLDDL